MALIKPDIESVILSQMDTKYGSALPEFIEEREKFADFLSDVIMEVLLNKLDIIVTAQTTVVSGSSAGVYPAVTNVVKA